MSGLGGVNFEDLRIAGIDNDLNEASKTFKPKEKNNMDDEQLQKIGTSSHRCLRLQSTTTL